MAAFFLEGDYAMKNRSIIYIGGFNLYYVQLKTHLGNG
jgi:hypothetical protein